MYNKVVWKYFFGLCEVQIPAGNYLIVLRRKRMCIETKYKSIYSVDTDKIQFNLANKARRKASAEPRDPSKSDFVSPGQFIKHAPFLFISGNSAL